MGRKRTTGEDGAGNGAGEAQASPRDDDTRPERCPLFPAYRTLAVGWIEAHRYVPNGRGGERTTVVQEQFDPALTEVQLARRLEPGRYLLKLKGRGGDHKTQRDFGVESRTGGASPGDGGAGGGDGGFADGEVWEPDREWRALIRQQSDVLPPAFESLTQAVVRAGEVAAEQARANGDRMFTLAQQTATMAQAHAAQIAALTALHKAEVEAAAAREAKLRAEVDKLTGENAGYLRDRAQSAGQGARGWIRDLKELSPELPRITGVLERAGKAWRGELKAGATADPKQLEGATPAATNGAAAAPSKPRDPFGD